MLLTNLIALPRAKATAFRECGAHTVIGAIGAIKFCCARKINKGKE